MTKIITNEFKRGVFLSILLSIILFSFQTSSAYTVTSITAAYHNGQVFITWNCPTPTNLQYNLYRSTSPLISSTQLTSNTNMGFVRDNSSKNMFWSDQLKTDVFYKIQASDAPLGSSQGLYVVTCTDNQSYYYAVTVTNLSDNVEDKTILVSQNSLLLPVSESAVQPLPVWQDSITTNNGEVKQHYVLFGNNQDTPLYPAMVSVGSYGFNFWYIKRGTASKYPLFISFEGFGAKPDENVAIDSAFTNCYILGIFDWWPIYTDEGEVGNNSFFLGYHEDFNIYSNNNPVPTKGVIRTYSQNIINQNIKWIKKQFTIDSAKIYLKGSSSSGYGALLTAVIHPEKYAAVYTIVEPNALSPASSEITKQMWGVSSSNIKTDIVNWSTGDTLIFKSLTDIQKMLNTNELLSVPVIYDIHGKNDASVVWSTGKITWLDSLESNHMGGAWYWDQRDHGGGGKNFITEEIEPNYYRFATNKSYPAFQNCSINQDPGNGTSTSGDPYGAINGYLDWRDDNIKDKKCKYWITLKVKDFYVGGVLDLEQYSNCTSDVTIRRAQTFAPAIGSLIKWKVMDVNNIKIQNSSFTYNGGLIIIPGVMINKTGNTLKLTIDGCVTKIGDDEDEDFDDEDSPVSFSKSPDGYTADVDLIENEPLQFIMYDLLGRKVWEKKLQGLQGANLIKIPAPSFGIYLI
ncbi:MAG: hypothetical protein LH473_13180, partial [Chitinophagales bacterium]|nr:hypothetical protein [Chitinophagales bacterium]